MGMKKKTKGYITLVKANLLWTLDQKWTRPFNKKWTFIN